MMQTRNQKNIRLIDVSHHQGMIDWLKVADTGIQGAFVKATEGVGYTDPLFRRNATGAPAAGLHVGFYHYARPETPNSAKNEAEDFVQAINGLPSTLPHVLDLEGASKQLGKDKLTDWAYEWLTTVQRLTGHAVMLYTGGYFAREYCGSKLGEFPLWIAHYGVDTPMSNDTWDQWACFQYADDGFISGIGGGVDLDEMDLEFWEQLTTKKMDISAAQKVIDCLGTLYMASADKAVQEAAHYAADALRVAAGLEVKA